MNPDTLLELTRNAMTLTLLLSAPIVATAALIGLAVGFLQAITSIQDQTLPAALKLLVVGALVALLGTWFGRETLNYADRVFSQLSQVSGSAPAPAQKAAP